MADFIEIGEGRGEVVGGEEETAGISAIDGHYGGGFLIDGEEEVGEREGEMGEKKGRFPARGNGRARPETRARPSGGQDAAVGLGAHYRRLPAPRRRGEDAPGGGARAGQHAGGNHPPPPRRGVGGPRLGRLAWPSARVWVFFLFQNKINIF
jgi:hypothetical protein